MSREQRIRKFGTRCVWETILKKQFSIMNIEFEEIVFIEEVIPYSHYIGYSRIKSRSDKDEFIETTVTFTKNGFPCISCYPVVLNSIMDQFDGGVVLLDKISSISNLDGLPRGSNK